MKKEGQVSRFKIFFGVLVVLLLAQGLNAVLSISSFEKVYLKTLISSYEAVGKDFQRKVDKALRFGKDLQKFLGIKALLKDVKKNNPALDNVSITLPDGTIIHSLDESLTGSQVSTDIRKNFSKNQKPQLENYILTDGKYYVLLPIQNWRKKWAGTINISFKQELIKKKTKEVIFQNLKILGLTVMIASILLFLGLFTVVNFNQKTIPKLRLSILILFVLGLAQLFYSFYNSQEFRNNYLEIIQNKTKTVTQLFTLGIENLLSKGIQIDRLTKVDQILGEIVQTADEIETIKITNHNHKVLYEPKLAKSNLDKVQEKSHQSSFWSRFLLGKDKIYQVQYPLKKGSDIKGYVELTLSKAVIGKKIQEIVLDSLTVVVISFLFVGELIIFIFIFIRKQLETSSVQTEELEADSAHALIRPIAFMFFFAAALSNSFLPLYMRELLIATPTEFFGLSRDIILGLPISIEMLAIVLVLVPGGTWMDKKGWHQPFFFGIIVTAIGAFLCAIANNPIAFSLYRGVVGLGYGLTWMAVQGFVVKNSSQETKAQGMSHLFAGLFAGIICGAAVGAMLADRLGYAAVFYVVAALVLLPISLSFIFLRDYFNKPVKEEVVHTVEEKADFKEFFHFFFKKNVFSIFAFCMIPNSVVLVGVLFYLSPIYLNQIGTTQSDIGRALMVFGLCMIYIAPIISRLIDRSPSQKKYIVTAGLLSGLGLCIFFLYEGFYAVLAMILLLGIASSFGDVAQTVFVLNLKEADALGQGRVMAIQRAVDKFGQALGPVVLGSVIAFAGIKNGVGMLGVIYIILTFLFIFMARETTTKSPE
ncbi:MAG: putative MFS family arabinose efflux permease [bacterium]|jgi:predicted MFS family arabinose efflux permease